MWTKFVRRCTAATDLKNFARDAYWGKQYRDERTKDVYQFITFVEGSPDGEVQARNITQSRYEILPMDKWSSFSSISDQQRIKTAILRALEKQD